MSYIYSAPLGMPTLDIEAVYRDRDENPTENELSLDGAYISPKTLEGLMDMFNEGVTNLVKLSLSSISTSTYTLGDKLNTNTTITALKLDSLKPLHSHPPFSLPEKELLGLKLIF